MNLQKPRRKRGVILTLQGWKKLENALRKSAIQEKSGARYTLEELSELTGLAPLTVARILERKVGVDKQSLALFFKAFDLELDEGDYGLPAPDFERQEGGIINTYRDWGEAVDVSVFYGRCEELTQLQQWVLDSGCRLVGLLGMGGIGKTSLSVKLALEIQDEFEYGIWRSLRNAPPVEDILANLIQFLSKGQETDLPETIDGRISRLIDYLRSSRCLLVLDNAEAILQSGDTPQASRTYRAGSYREGYEGYGELLRRVGEVKHRSCLILTSREKPVDFASLEGESLPVRSLRLTGLNSVEGQEILKAKGLSGTEDERRKLIECYGGNPLALNIVSTSIRELFDGNISEFLSQGTTVFGGIRNLLDQQFNRLSDFEMQIMYWLAINREPISLSELREDIVSPVPQSKLLEALQSLGRRSLIEKSAGRFTLQPVVMEYMTERFIEQVCEEIKTEEIALFKSHALIQAQGKDYVRDTQVRLILKPVVDSLLSVYGSNRSIESRLTQILSTLRNSSPLEPGYTGGNVFNLLRHMQVDLWGYDFSNLTIWQADLREVELHEANFAHSNLARSVFTETIGSIASVTFSPDGRLLATSDAEGEIHLWQAADGKQLAILQGDNAWVWSVAFSPDGKTLVSGGADQTVRCWDVSTGQCLKTLQGHVSWIWSVAFSPDGQTVASCSPDEMIKLWDVSTGECRKTLLGHTSGVHSVAFSSEGRTLASGSADQTVRLWDVSTGKCCKTLQGHTKTVHSVAFSPDGSTLVTGGADQTVRLWDVSTGQCCKTLQGHTKTVYSVAFSPRGDQGGLGEILASGSGDQTVRLWDVDTGNCCMTLQGHTDDVWSVAFSTDGQTVVSGGQDGAVKLWDVSTGLCRKTLQGYVNGVWSVAFSPRGDQGGLGEILASGSQDATIKLWDVSDGKCRKTLTGHTSWILSVAFTLDAHMLASGSADGTVKLWDVSTGQCRKTLRGHVSGVWSVAFSPRGNQGEDTCVRGEPPLSKVSVGLGGLLASGGQDEMIKLWDVSTGQCRKTLHGHSGWVTCVIFSPDGGTLVSSSADGTVKLWDISSGECLNTLQGHTDWVHSVTFSPIPPNPPSQGGLLASGSEDQTVRLWDWNTGQCLRTLHGHTSGVRSVAFSPDGQTLASGSEDQTVRLWDVRDGKCREILQGHTKPIWSIALSSASYSTQGTILASGSQDETIKLWDVKLGHCVKTLRAAKPYEGMNITGASGLTEAQKITLKALGAVEG